MEIYLASVMVFHENEKDVLMESTDMKNAVSILFAELIKNNKSTKKDFYEVYWKMVDPERWETIKQN